MNCQLARNRILAVEEPADLPDELAAHVEGCAVCKAWYQNFLVVERALPTLPVPVSDGLAKIAVLEKVRGTPAPTKTAPVAMANHKPAVTSTAAAKPMPLNLDEDLPRKRRPSFGQLAARFWPAGLVAATLLIGTIAWLSLRGGKPAPTNNLPPDPFLDSLVKLNVDLAKTETPAQRVAILAQVADELNQEMRDIARADPKGDDMEALKEMYRRIVLDGLVAQAKLVDKTQREIVLGKIADGLAQAGQRAEQTAAEAPQHSADRLRDAAVTAREGTKKIRTFIKEATS